jgi:hypothetical protein
MNMSSRYYFAQNGQKFGPVTAAQLRQLLAQGRLQSQDLIWKEGLVAWVPLAKLDEMEPVQPPVPVLRPSAIPGPASAPVPLPAPASVATPANSAGPAAPSLIERVAGEVGQTARAMGSFLGGVTGRAFGRQTGPPVLPADRSGRWRLAAGFGAVALLFSLMCCTCTVPVGGWFLFRHSRAGDSFDSDKDHPAKIVGKWKGKTSAGIVSCVTTFDFQKNGRVFWNQDFGKDFEDLFNEGSGNWRVERVEGDRYTLQYVPDSEPDRTYGWILVFKGEDKFTITEFADAAITVTRQK